MSEFNLRTGLLILTAVITSVFFFLDWRSRFSRNKSETASFAASTWLALFPAASPGGKRLSSDIAVIRD